MNNVYDIAHELASSLKETDQYKNYKAAKEKVERSESVSKMINDFNEKNMKLQTESMVTGKMDEELLKQVQALYSIVVADPLAAEYLNAELQFSTVMSELYGILGEVAKLE